VTPEEYAAKFKDKVLTEDQAGNAWATGVSKDKWETFMSQVYATAKALETATEALQEARTVYTSAKLDQALQLVAGS
jgi:hypothetical protein